MCCCFGQIHKVLCEMPAVNIQLSVRGWWDASNQNEETERRIKIPADRNNWIEVHAEQEYTLMVSQSTEQSLKYVVWKKSILHLYLPVQVHMHRSNFCKELKAHAPRFSRSKDEGWFLTLGSVDDGELLALKRVTGVRGRSTQQISFYTPPKEGNYSYPQLICTVIMMRPTLTL